MDFNVIGAEPQAEVLNSALSAQIRTFKIDVKHLEMIVPSLKEMQQHSGKLVKDYHQYLSKKQRKTQGLPYHMIKKFELLQSTLSQAHKVLQRQCSFFQNHIRNREFQKSSQHAFFKKTLKSYDERRKHLKNYILNNEARMQIVEDEVTKNVQYETHKYTVFLSELDVQRLQHNYHPKMEVNDSVYSNMKANIDLRQKIQQKLKKHCSEQSKQKQKKTQEVKSQVKNGKIQINSRLSININSFFYNILAKLNVRKMFMSRSLQQLLKQKQKLSHYNQSLKIAIDTCSQMIDLSQLEWNIIADQYKQQFQNCSKLQLLKKVTKTDYYIYLKEIYRETEQRIKNYGIAFQYSISHQPGLFHLFRSKSSGKYYFLSKNNIQKKNREIYKQIGKKISIPNLDKKEQQMKKNKQKILHLQQQIKQQQSNNIQQQLEYKPILIKDEIQQKNNLNNILQNSILQKQQTISQKYTIIAQLQVEKPKDENIPIEKTDKQ